MSTFPFKINSVPLDGSGTLPALAYQGASFSYEDLESDASGLNQFGTNMRDVVGRKWRWSLEFAPMSTSDLTALLSAVNANTFSFTFPNVLGGTDPTITITAFVTSRIAPFWDWRPGSGTAKWGNVSFDLQEV